MRCRSWFLGYEQYIDLYVRGFVKNLSWMAIPLEEEAYKLDVRFAEASGDVFFGRRGDKAVGERREGSAVG